MKYIEGTSWGGELLTCQNPQCGVLFLPSRHTLTPYFCEFCVRELKKTPKAFPTK
jgi:hypothetical protein